jgi:plasmid replication initiation protein
MVKKQEDKKNIEPFQEMEQLNLFFALDIQDVKFRDSSKNQPIPNFSLQKKRQINKVEFVDERTGNYFIVYPHQEFGQPTIWDYDILIFLISLLNEGNKKGKPPPNDIYFIPYRLFLQCRWIKSTSRRTSGSLYKRLDEALDRLSTTYNKTNIKTADNKTIENRWHWITDIKKTTNSKGKVEGVQVRLCEWLYQLVIRKENILSISPEYFKIRSGIDRYLYRLLRKFLGSQDFFEISFDRLFDYYPPGKDYSLFKRDIRKAIDRNGLPEMNMKLVKKTKKEYLLATLKDGAVLERRLPYSMREDGSC